MNNRVEMFRLRFAVAWLSLTASVVTLTAAIYAIFAHVIR
jgi:hypothetical protein